ncbi:MAG: hypothetical protein WCA82_13895 [Jiangellales bacterium]
MASTLVRCPVCGAELTPAMVDPVTGMVECTCGHRADAHFVNEAAYLQARLDWVLDRIRDSDVAPRAGGAAVPTAPIRMPVQTILLSIGAFLLVVAASVFTAVAWPRLGPAGQVGIVLLVTTVVTSLAVRLRTRLHGTAEALAALAFGLVIVDAVALSALGLAPEEWLDAGSVFWLVLFATLAVAGVVAGRWTGLRSWSWMGWGSSAAVLGAMAAVLIGPDESDSPALALAMSVLAVGGALLLTGSYVVAWTRVDRRPMVLAGTVAFLLGMGVSGSLALAGEAVGAVAFTTALTAATLAGMAAVIPVAAGSRHARQTCLAVAVVLTSVAVGLLASLLPRTAVVAVGVGALGGGLLLAGISRGRGVVGLLPAGALWGAWAVMVLADVDQGLVGAFALAVSASLLTAAWIGAGDAGVTWLAWPAAIVAYAAFALLVPESYPSLLEAWTLPGALLLAIAGAVGCRGRAASSLETVGPALSVALLPSALATWFSPWVSSLSGDTTEHVVRLVVVLVVGGVLMVVGARQHALGLLLPASGAVLVAGSAQVWTGLATLPRWIALALVGTLLVLAGARFEWVRDEGRRARTWMHQMS